MLHEVAGQVTDDVVKIVNDWRKPAALCGVAAAVCLGAGLALDDAVARLALIACAAAFLLRVLLLWRARNRPLIELFADGFSGRGLDRMVPWIGVEGVTMTRQISTRLLIHLKPTTKLPKRVSGWHAMVNARQQTVTLLGVRPRGMTAEALVQLIEHTRAAAHARAEAAGEMEPGYSMILSEEELNALLSGDES